MPPQRGTSNDRGVDSLSEPLVSESIDDTLGAAAESPEIASIANSKDIVVRKCCKRGGENENNVVIRVNHNVFLNLLLSVLYGISNSLWSGTAYLAFLKKMGHGGNGPVGNIEAVSGLASLVCALPIGYFADKMGKSIVIRSGGMLLFTTSILQIGILQWVGTDFDKNEDDEDSNSNRNNTALWLMGAIMVLWGLGDGVVNGPCQALYADSTPEGQRSTYFTYQFACYLSASAVGPLVSIVLFQVLGDEWDLYHLRLVIYTGLGMEVFNSWLMMLFDDSKALDEDQDTVESTDENDGDDASFDWSNEGIEQRLPSERDTTPTTLQKRQEWIPYLVFFSGLVSSLGSGMTVKFFPLFFKDEIGMSPSQVQVTYVLVPLVMIVMGSLCTKIANAGVGRVQTTALYEVGGISLLLAMVVFKNYLDVHPFLLVPIYVMRTSLMNATYPLQQSILMDFVPKDKRARWKSLDSVASFGWCGSAAFGGWLADKYDYTHTFLLTAVFQSVSLGIWCCLLPLVPRVEGSELEEDGEEGPLPDQAEAADDHSPGFSTTEENGLTELSEPLL